MVDVAARKSVDSFTLSDARRHVRALAYEVDPQHRTMVIVARTATKLIDRWEIGAPEFILYDLAAHKVTRTVPWPIDPEPSYFSASRCASRPTANCSTCSATRSTSSTPPPWSRWTRGTCRCRPRPRWAASTGAVGRLGRRRGTATGLFTMRDAMMGREAAGHRTDRPGGQDRRHLPVGPGAHGRRHELHGGARPPRAQHPRSPRSADTNCGPSTWRSGGVLSRVEVPTRTRMQMRAELERPALPLRGRPDDRGLLRRRVEARAHHRARLRHDVRHVRHRAGGARGPTATALK